MVPTDPWEQTVATARRLEMFGYHHLWVYDHLSWQRYQDRPWHATVPWLTGLAASTTRIRLGTMVANPNIRHPLLLAKDAMTIDHVSAGRLTLGLGAGGTGFDATALGQMPRSTTERLSRLEEFAVLLDGLLRGNVHNHDGDWYTVHEARLLPGCVQTPRVPLAIAAGGRRGLTLAASVADAWITYGDTTNVDVSAGGTEVIVAQQVRRLEDACADADRDPTAIDRIYLIGNTEARPLSSIAAFTDFMGRYADLGFTDLVFHLPRPDDPVWNEPFEIVEQIADAHLG